MQIKKISGDKLFPNPDLRLLMSQGYGFSDDISYLNEQVLFEYQGRPKITAFLAYKGDQIIGSLSMAPANLQTAPCFWQALPGQTSTSITGIFNIQGIVVLPEFRKKGIMGKIYLEMIKSLQPTVILSVTKSPSFVQAHCKTVLRQGYFSFLGLKAIDGSHPSMTKLHAQIHKASWAWRNIDVNPKGIAYVSIDQILPNTGEIKNLSPKIKACFQDLSQAQKQAENTKSAVLALISIKPTEIPHLQQSAHLPEDQNKCPWPLKD